MLSPDAIALGWQVGTSLWVGHFFILAKQGGSTILVATENKWQPICPFLLLLWAHPTCPPSGFSITVKKGFIWEQEWQPPKVIEKLWDQKAHPLWDKRG